MTVQIDAIFENGVFRPTRTVPLSDQQRVRLTIDAEGADQVSFTLGEDAWSAFCEALDAPTRQIPELRKLLVEPGVFDARPSSPR
jgi:predicted DNA-binding antitoxin AbrB/MazE fold protein